MVVHHLYEVATGLRANSTDAEALCSGLDGEALQQRPAPDKWSVAECLTHLTMSSEAYFPLWRAALTLLKPAVALPSPPVRSAASRYKMDMPGRILARMMEPPPRLRLRATAKFRPLDPGPAEQVLPAFLASQEQVLAVLIEADGLPIDRMKVRSPFDRRVSYSVWSSFVVTVAHQRRHLWQAHRVAAVCASQRS